MPNVMAYTDKFADSCLATAQMFLIAGGLTFVFGAVFGILLTVTRPGGIAENKAVYRIVDLVTNIFRSIPFVILLIFLIPLTRLIVGTAIGVKGAIVPLVFGAVPFFTRQVEVALAGVDPGKVEAATAMGSSKLGIIFRVYLHEAVPDLIRVVTVTAILRTEPASPGHRECLRGGPAGVRVSAPDHRQHPGTAHHQPCAVS